MSSHRHERFAPPIYHNKRNHVYSIPRTVLQSDVIVNISKLKTHRKVGLTCALKNVVGITNRKYWLPHFRERIDASYLDALPGAVRMLLGARDLLTRAVFKSVRLHNLAAEYPCRDGNWPGDDTTWLMVLDLYRIMLLANSTGEMTEVPQRRHFCVIDGIVGGGGFGPLAPRSVLSRTLILGINPRSVDAVAAHLMGYDPTGIRLLGPHSSSRYHIPGESNIRALSIVGTESPLIPLDFNRPRGWKRLPPSSPI